MKTLHYMILMVFVYASPVFAADPPTENQGANALNSKIREQSTGLLQLYKFEKTNGQKAKFGGIEIYEMECSIEVIAIQDCAMTGYTGAFGVSTWDGSFRALKAQKNVGELDKFNPLSGANAAYKQVAKGEIKRFTVHLTFELTERGWRTEGRLPPNTPFVVPDLPKTIDDKKNNRAEASKPQRITFPDFASADAWRIVITQTNVLSTSAYPPCKPVFSVDATLLGFAESECKVVGIFSDCDKHSIVLVDPITLQRLKSFPVQGAVNNMAFSSDNRKIFFIINKQAGVIEVDSGKTTMLPGEHRLNDETQIVWHQDGNIYFLDDNGGTKFDLDTLQHKNLFQTRERDGETDYIMNEEERKLVVRKLLYSNLVHKNSYITIRGDVRAPHFIVISSRNRNYSRLLLQGIQWTDKYTVTPDLKFLAFKSGEHIRLFEFGLRDPVEIEFNMVLPELMALGTKEYEKLKTLSERKTTVFGFVYPPQVNPLNGKIIGPDRKHKKGYVRFAKLTPSSVTANAEFEQSEPFAVGDIVSDIKADGAYDFEFVFSGEIWMPLIRKETMAKPEESPLASATVTGDFVQVVCPGGKLGEFHHGTKCIGYYDDKNHLVDIQAASKPSSLAQMATKKLVHAGIDIVAAKGSAIFPIADGTVVDVVKGKDDPAFGYLGYMVIVKHDEKLRGLKTYSLYLHMNEPPAVAIGKDVVAGKTQIGAVGSTGAAFGPHIHLEIRHFSDRLFPHWGNIYGKESPESEAKFDSTEFSQNWTDPETFSTISTVNTPASSGSTPTVPAIANPAKPQGVVALDPKQLMKDCLTVTTDPANPAMRNLTFASDVFNAKYKNRTVRFTGTVDRITAPTGTVVFKPVGIWPNQATVEAMISDTNSLSGGKIKPKSQITVEGLVSSFTFDKDSALQIGIVGFGSKTVRIIRLSNVSIKE